MKNKLKNGSNEIVDTLGVAIDRAFVDAERYGDSNSKDPYSRNGAALLDARGERLIVATNKIPDRVQPHTERWTRPSRYLYVEFAPRVALFEALKRGYDVRGGWLVSTVFPGADCARALIACGVRNIAAPPPQLRMLGESDHQLAAQRMFTEAGVRIKQMREPIFKGLASVPEVVHRKAIS